MGPQSAERFTTLCLSVDTGPQSTKRFTTLCLSVDTGATEY